MEPPTIDAEPGSPSAPPGPRQLRRRPDDHNIAGVCAGVAEYFDVDPVIVRIAAVVLLFTGPGAFAYILAWIFVPAATEDEGHANRGPVDRKDRGTQIFGIVLLALALSVIWGDWWSPARRWFFPIGLMALGAWLLLRRDKDDLDVAPTVPPVPLHPTAPKVPWAWGPASTTAAAPTTPDPAALASAPSVESTDPTEPFAADATAGEDDGGEPPTAPWDLTAAIPPMPPVPPGPPASARRRRLLGPIVFGALLIWTGLAWLFGVSVQNGLAVGLCLLGVGFVLGAFVGGSRALILPALVVGAALAVTAVVDIPLSGPIGDQRWAPARLADVSDRYEVSVGQGTLDLSAIDLPAGHRLPVEVTVGVGHLVVLVPSDLAVDVTTDVGAGESDVLDFRQSGAGISGSRYDEEGASGGTIVLDLQVGLGQIEVRRVASERPSLSVPS
jgi:phage shock protein PspC (stress-responsive transcriptional regulator)